MRKSLLLSSVFGFLFGQLDTVLVVDASSYNDWVYYSIDQLSVVEIVDPENSLDWDLAFQRKHIRTNGGLAGPGNGGAAVDSTVTWIEEWENINSVPENTFFLEDTLLNDFYDPITHTFGEGIKNPALNSWGWFNDDYTLIVNHYMLYVMLANGEDIVKFWPTNYYSDNGLGGHIQFRIETGLSIPSFCEYENGDINYDGDINVVDIVQLVYYVLNNVELNECDYFISDLNEDSIVNVIDIVTLVSIIL
tara:strand:+ start:1144 stop:1890 length:747 start_codon:yes stop_codon:yes gene_type:complete